ncbi:Uma2 family endonuclease [Fibrella sp. HMF5335]|uniref:Uma2 family endonuclease n=1 Tax=Fibrella rubiginis TaxID=2817060 RepID=A0A939K5B8_9BACT|nr:Uma2 family endonuclease [Fibrella rubiginis]MBO0936295.1 Uma2 family endonuclease [Fibrella rubiginis]
MSITTRTPTRTTLVSRKVPASLMYEEIDGRPYYYRGYRSVISRRKTKEAITGASALQSAIVSLLIYILYKHLSFDDFLIATNEPGLHISKGSNLSNDIAVFDQASLPTPLDDKYFSVPPKVVIEIDVKIDLPNNVSETEYVYDKTQKMLDFGVEKVIWILTKTQRTLIAEPNERWILTDWNDTVEIFPGCGFELGKLLRSKGVIL